MSKSCPHCGCELRQRLPADCRGMREAARVSLSELARELNCSKQIISQYELGQKLVQPEFAQRYRAAVRELQKAA